MDVMEELKPIPREFNANGMSLKLRQRNEKVAMYGIHKHGKILGFEVHKLRIGKESTFKMGDREIFVPRRELLSGNEDFGSYGWHYACLEDALRKFGEICSSQPPTIDSTQCAEA